MGFVKFEINVLAREMEHLMHASASLRAANDARSRLVEERMRRKVHVTS